MTRTKLIAGLLAVAGVAGCDSSVLDLMPVDEIPVENAIVNEETAEAALVGAYAILEDTDLYGGDWVLWTELLSDNVDHTGTFGSYGEAHLLNVTAANGSVEGSWNEFYEGINRVNLLIREVPTIEDFDPEVADRVLGEAYALRALHYFNLVRGWGGVPLVLQPPASLSEAAQVARASEGEVYAQVEADLAEAEARLAAAGMDDSDHTRVTPGFVDALQAKVHLYQQEWAEAEAEAREVIESGDYALVEDYASLFTADGAATEEDIFRVAFTPVYAANFGYYYQFEGRFEIGATQEIYDLYGANDERFDVSFDEMRSDGIEVVKYPTTAGSEDFHVIRYSEVLLILAEALAQQGGAANLAEAVGYLNQVRTRSGAPAYDPAVLDTQAELLEAIYLERRLELAFEGDRWFDLVRLDRVREAVGDELPNPENLLPIPVSETDVTENIDQNEGYS